MPSGEPPHLVDVAVVEDVWGKALTELSGRLHVDRQPAAWSDPQILRAVVRPARAIIVRNRTTVDRALLEQVPELKVVARAGAGLDNVRPIPRCGSSKWS